MTLYLDRKVMDFVSEIHVHRRILSAMSPRFGVPKGGLDSSVTVL